MAEVYKDFDAILKLVIVGDSGVGKSSLAERYINNNFKKDMKSTVGMDVFSKNITINDKSIRLCIWDTAGQEKFEVINSRYYKDCKIIMIVFDVQNKKSLGRVSKFKDEIIQNYTSEDEPRPPLYLVGTKADKDANREVTREEGEKIAQRNSLKYSEVSSLDNTNVDGLFKEAIISSINCFGAKYLKEDVDIGNKLRAISKNIEDEQKCCIARSLQKKQ